MAADFLTGEAFAVTLVAVLALAGVFAFLADDALVFAAFLTGDAFLAGEAFAVALVAFLALVSVLAFCQVRLYFLLPSWQVMQLSPFKEETPL